MKEGPGAPWFQAKDCAGIASLLEALGDGYPGLVDQARERLSVHPELGGAVRQLSIELFGQHARRLHSALEQAATGQCEPLDALLLRFGARCADLQVAVAAWCQAAEVFRNLLVPELIRALGPTPARLLGALSTLERVVDRATIAVTQGHLAEKEALLVEQRRRTDQALLRFSRLFEAGVLGILVCDLVGNVLEANDGFLEMVGYSREELLSGKVSWGEMTPPEWRHLDEDAVEQLKVRGVTRPWEKEYLRKDGTRVPILVGVAMLNEVECVAFVLDITQRKRLDELRERSAELEAQNRRIQEASRLKSEFLANMSHELRTPLNSIIGFAQLLHDGEVGPDAPEHREFLGDILTSGKHLLQLINDVLDLAKVESGKMDFRPEIVDLGALAAEVAAVLRSIAASKRIVLEVDVDSSLTPVTIDPARLKQVLYNYLSNAVKFTPEGGSIFLRVRGETPDTFRVEVEDTGIGISPADFGRLFVEFQQLEAGATKKHGGTGLGLALTKRVVEAQEGSVGVKSTPGQGSLFFAVLPRHAKETDGIREELVVPLRHEGAASVLVVEDDVRDRALLTNALSNAGYDVDVAITGHDAVSICLERRFDAITLDLLLPDTTGLEVLHRVRTDGKNRETPVVVVTVVAERGVIGGFAVHDYLQKPVNGQDLLISLKHAGVLPEKSGEILVVDDDPSALKLMDVTLRQLGYGTCCVLEAERALEISARRRPAAVILDLMMPRVDGFEFLLRFRSNPEHHAVPVVVWTMKDLTMEDHARLRSVAHAVISKGTGGSLVDQLRTLLPPKSAARGDPLE